MVSDSSERRAPLSVLIDRAAGDGPRDAAFVRAFATWLTARGPYLELPLVEALGLRDVAVTFTLKRRVRLVATGAPPEPHPGEVTLTVDESDFPWLEVVDRATPRDTPYTFCTLDHAVAGRAVRVTQGPRAGSAGVLVVSATVDGRVEHRVRVDDDVLTLPAHAVELA